MMAHCILFNVSLVTISVQTNKEVILHFWCKIGCKICKNIFLSFTKMVFALNPSILLHGSRQK